MLIHVLVAIGIFLAVEGRSTFNSVTTLAGTGSTTSSGTGGSPLSAGMSGTRSVVVDTAGTVYVLEQGAYCIRKFSTSANIVQVFAGVCGSPGSSGDNGPASSALFNTFVTLFINTVGSTYVADYGNQKVRVISSAGIIKTFAGTGTATDTGNGGMATSATVYKPHGVWGNSMGAIYTCSEASIMRMISVSGIITVFAGLRVYLAFTLT